MRRRDYLTINVYWFGLAFLWNGLHPIILPALLLQFVPETLKNTTLGGLTFAGLMLAIVTQPISGGLSDRTPTRWGKRRPWILVGTLLSLVFLGGMAGAGSVLTILVMYMLLQTASNTAHGPAQALIPDLVPPERLGLGVGIKNLFEMSALVITSLVAGGLMGSGNSGRAFTITGAVLGASALVTVLFAPEKGGEQPVSAVREPGLRDLIRLDYQRYPDFAWLVFSRFLILLGIYTIQSFAQYFIQDRLAAPNPAQVTGNLMATIGITLTLLVLPAGLLSDRFGRRRLNIYSGALAAFGIFLLIPLRSVTTLYVVGGVIGVATGVFLSVNWALAADLSPVDEAGKYLGLTNLATGGAAAVSRLGGPLIDGINSLRPGEYLGYPALFLLAAVSVVIGTVLMRRVLPAERSAPIP